MSPSSLKKELPIVLGWATLVGLGGVLSRPTSGGAARDAGVAGASAPSAVAASAGEGVLRTFSRGALSGGLSSILLQPLDVTKTRQVGFIEGGGGQQARVARVSVAQAGLEIFRQDGLAGLWRGVGVSLLRASLGPGIYFTVLDRLQRRSDEALALHQAGGKRAREYNEGRKLELALEGAASRAVAGTLMTPLSVVKTRFEWARGRAEVGTFAMLSRVFREERFAGLFRGTLPTLARDIPSSGLYLLLYQGLFQPAAHRWGDGAVSEPLLNMSSAVLAGVVSSILTQPFDNLKTHTQLNSCGALHGTRALWHARGLMGFFEGMGVRLVRRPIANAITWTIFEISKSSHITVS